MKSKDIEEAIGFDALYRSMHKCRKGVMWKDSAASFYLNGIENTLRLEKQLREETYRPRPTKRILITHPKRREAVSIAFRDRVYQRSMNDNIIYPAMTKNFIRENMACQKSKGTDMALDALDEFMSDFYRNSGMNGYVLQCDIQHYYQTMRHDIALEMLRKNLSNDAYIRTREILNKQYSGYVGYNPGSQMVQILGISYLDEMDHMIKNMGIRYYLRYMDDFILIHHDRSFLERCRHSIDEHLSGMDMKLHPAKTRIYPISRGIKFLGFTHRIVRGGRVIRIVSPANVKAEKRKLRRMSNLLRKGKITRGKMDECYESWKSHVARGNSRDILRRMDRYYINLLEEEENGTSNQKSRRFEHSEKR